MKATHALTMNGRINSELKDPEDAPEVLILKRMRLLDGSKRFSLSLWRLPPGISLDSVDYSSWPQEYIQAAGSRRQMTVELRAAGKVGFQQFAVGRSSSFDADRSTVSATVAWDAFTTDVDSSEVFDAEGAGELFVCYYNTGSIPLGYSLRVLNL